MKEIEINLSEKNQKELNIKVRKILSKQRKRKFAIRTLLIIFVIMLTMTFSGIGEKMESEFLLGQLDALLIFIVTYVFERKLLKFNRQEIEEVLFDNKELMEVINQEIEKSMKGEQVDE